VKEFVYYCLLHFLHDRFQRNQVIAIRICTECRNSGTGAAVAQIIILFTSPVVTRLYTPGEMGFFAIFMSIVSGIVVVASGRYELGIVLPKKDSDAYRLIILACIICTTASLFSLLIIGLILLLFPELSRWFLLVPLSVFLLGTYNIYYNWSNRIKKYKLIAQSRIINAVINVLVTIGAGFGKTGFAGLIIGNLTGQVGGNISITEFKRLRDEARNSNKKSLREIAKEYNELPRKNSFQALLDMYQLNGLVYLIPAFFSQAIVGWYAFAMRILQAPVSLIGMAIAQVFYRKASETYNQQGNLRYIVKKTMINSALIALPVLVILLFWGPVLFSFIFGDNWEESGEYARILAPWIYLDFIRLSISQFPIVIGKLRQMLLFSLSGSVIITISILIAGIFMNDVKFGFVLLSSFMSVLVIFYIGWIYYISGKVRYNKV